MANSIIRIVIERTIKSCLEKAARQYKAVALTGPRQSGKTTLAQECFPNHPYLSLENPDFREMALADPRGVLKRYADGCIFDEVQRAPLLLSYLQEVLDASSETGRFILTGSQQFGMMEGITQSLAGRCALMTLLPLSLQEIQGSGKAPSDLDEHLFKGGYPPIFDQDLEAEQWLNGYISTYLERDVRQVSLVKDLGLFTRFLALCAGSAGQELNFSRLGADCGVNHGTARHWLSILEASFVVFRLPPHFKNFRKRIVKSPKLYFYDTGLLTRLLRVETPDQLFTHPLRGALFENWVVSELLKGRYNRWKEPNFYFWRENNGLEVDVLVDQAGTLAPIEIKSGATVSSDWFRGLQRWERLAGRDAGRARLIYGGDRRWVRGETEIVPWEELSQVVNTL
ncbi:MAG: ATP-binding protein [Opitutales bacterium]|nr:ATP-binding protein [Opitutales bacterium]